MEKELITALKEQFPKMKILLEEPLSKHTTFKIGGPAEVMAFPNLDEIKDLVVFCKDKNIAYTILGNGSNVLVGDEGIDGVVIIIGEPMSEVRFEGTKCTAGAGAMLIHVAIEACKKGLDGLVWASGIPGSIGGAVVMNAGAYGGEIKDVITEALVMDKEGDVFTLSKDELELSYRHSVIDEKELIVLSATFELAEGDGEKLMADVAELREKRMEKQPLEFPSAGSTFKRPEGYFAGKLIMDADLRGYSVGGAQVSEKHCGFVVNKGGATAKDVVTLMDDVKKIVLEKDGVVLEPEVRMIGKF